MDRAPPRLTRLVAWSCSCDLRRAGSGAELPVRLAAALAENTQPARALRPCATRSPADDLDAGTATGVDVLDPEAAVAVLARANPVRALGDASASRLSRLRPAQTQTTSQGAAAQPRQ